MIRQLGRGDRRRQPGLHRRRGRRAVGARRPGGAAGDDAGLDDARPAPGRRRGPGDPLGPDVGRARRGRVHLRRRHQLRAGVPPLPAARRAGHGARQPGGGDRPEADRARRGLVRHHAQHLVRGRRAGRDDDVPDPEVPARGTAGAAAAPPSVCCGRSVSPDTAFFWEGTAPPASCGSSAAAAAARCATRPGPMCPACGVARPGYVVAAGTGEVYSYVVHHHPPVPGRQLPIVIALVQLTEGVRMVGELLGVSPERARIGLPVRVDLRRGRRRADAARLAGGSAMTTETGADRTAAVLPELVIDVTPTFVIAAAIATRDFQDVHHDRDRAVERGSKDIFINILTTTGLVQRFVTDWAGPQAMVRKDRDPARRALLRGRHADVLRPGRVATARSAWSRSPAGAASAITSPARSAIGRGSPRDLRGGGDRRDRRHRVLQGLRPQRAAAGRRGDDGRAGRRRAGPRRRGRAGHVHHGQHRRDRAGPRARRRRAAVLQPGRLRRRRRLRDRAAGGDGRRHRGRRGGGLLPGAERAVRPPVRPGIPGRACSADLLRDRQRLALPDGPVHPGRDRGDDRPAVHARLRRDQRGLRPGHRRRPAARGGQPEGLVLPAADHARRASGVPVDRRAAAAARLLPGERRRGGRGRDQHRAGPRPAAAAGRDPRRRPGQRARTSSR